MIQLLDVGDDTSACHVTTDLQLDADWTSTDDSPLVIDGTALKVLTRTGLSTVNIKLKF